jgi:outer membrane protein assembly factor BamB
VAPGASLPLTWSEKENVAWKAELPGRGVSGPIVVGGRVFVTASDGVRQDRLYVLCFDAQSGDELWRRTFWATGRTLTHPFSANAAPTPVSDGKYVYAFFSSNDLACLDLDGNLRWYRGLGHDYPKAGNDVGMSCSPVLADDTIVVQVESQSDPFAAGIDANSGEERWRIRRDAAANWASPTVMRTGGETVVLLQSPSGLTAHDVSSGKMLWRHDARCGDIASPVFRDGRVFIPSDGLTVLAPPTEGTAATLLWNSPRMRPGPASAVVDEDRVYALYSGVLSCAKVEDGDLLWQLRVGGTHWTTPVIADGHLYCIDQEGNATVIRLGEKGEIVGTSQFGEPVLGSPAVSGNALFVRGAKHLWKIAAP